MIQFVADLMYEITEVILSPITLVYSLGEGSNEYPRE